MECRYSKYMFNEVQTIKYNANDNTFLWKGGENNLEYIGEGEWRLREQYYDSGNVVLVWELADFDWRSLGI